MISEYKGKDLKIRFEPHPLIKSRRPVYAWSISWYNKEIPRGIICRGTLREGIQAAKEWIDRP